MTQTATSRYAHMSKEQLIDALEKHDQTLQSIYATIHLPNERMAPGEKLFWIGARCILPQEKPNGNGLVRMPTDKVSAFIGMSESSTGRYANAVIERYDATKESVPYTTLKGQLRTLTYVDRDDPLWREPWTVDLPEEKERVINGNGKPCPRCHTNNLQVTTRRLKYQEIQECDCCGYKKISKVLDDQEQLEPMEYVPEEKGSQAEDLLESDKKDHTSGTAYVPSTPPGAFFEPSQKGLQAGEPFGDSEGEAVRLLLDIAGEHTEHIKMVGRDDQKYTTVPRALHPGDMFAHLRGLSSKGARLFYKNGKLRAACFDADTLEDWQRKKEAARLLAIAGFKPILEPSPAPKGDKHAGGGHLWIIFDALVDAYSALQTLYQYTGHLLRCCNEVWPPETDRGNRVRLPGGKYVAPNFEAWCKLVDADGHELSHDGAGAAVVLLQHQTPADLVNEYTRPDPEPQPPQTPPRRDARAGGVLGKDVAGQVIADFNASHSWQSLLGRPNRHGKYHAVWRNDGNPNVAINPKTDLAKDFSTNAWLSCSMDKYQVYCLIEGRADWEAFKKRDLDERCRKLREPIAS